MRQCQGIVTHVYGVTLTGYPDVAAIRCRRTVAVHPWTDVLGVMTADPNLVREASPVDRLSYDEALELAYFGTRMFHSRTIIPLRDCGAALVIRSTTQPSAPGTTRIRSGRKA